MSVSFIIWIYCNSRISKHCFRTSCSNYKFLIAIFNRVSDFPDFSIFILVIYLIISKCSLIMRTPVYNVFSTINKPIIVKFYKHFLYSFRKPFIHSKSLSCPVQRNSQFSKLLRNQPTMFFLPFPSSSQKLIIPNFFFRSSFISQHSLNFILRSNSSMIHSRNPKCIKSAHSLISNNRILY